MQTGGDGRVWIEFVNTRNGDTWHTDHITVSDEGALLLAGELIAAAREIRARRRPRHDRQPV